VPQGDRADCLALQNLLNFQDHLAAAIGNPQGLVKGRHVPEGERRINHRTANGPDSAMAMG
jgi:hypothetical protein